MARLEESLSNVFNPLGNGGREHETLEVLQACTLDCVDNESDVFLEPKVEHLISFVKNSVP